MKKLINKTIDDRLIEQNRNVVRIGNYINAITKIEWKCLVCENIWNSTPNNIFNNISNKKGCPNCNLKKITNDIIDNRLLNNERTIIRIGDVVNVKTKIDWKCLECKYEWKATPNHVVNGNNTGCPQCAKQVDITNEIVDNRLIKENIKIKRLGEVSTSKMKADWQCLTCDYIWTTTPNLILNKKTKCPSCSNCKRWTNDRFDKWLIENNKEIKRVGNIKTSHNKIDLKCLICEKEWAPKLNDMIQYSTHCPICSASKKYSNVAIEWLDYISIEENIHIQHIMNENEYRIPGTRYSVDGYCVETNTVYEFYGDVYHGNLMVFNRDEKCHPYDKSITAGELYEKTIEREKVIKSMGYNLITIWESEWLIY